MIAVRVGPEDGVIMETLSEQSLVDHCVIVDGPTNAAERGVVNAVASTSNDAQECDSPTNVVTSTHDFPQPVTRIIYHHGGSTTSTALLVGQQIIQQHHNHHHHHHHHPLQDEGDDETALLEEQALSPQQQQQHHALHSDHHFKEESEEMRAHAALLASHAISEENDDELAEAKHLHRMHLLQQAAADAENNSDTVYQTDELEAEVDEAHVVHHSHHHHQFSSHPAQQHQLDAECEDFDKESEQERHHHIHHHQPHILSTSGSSSAPTIIISDGSSANGSSMSIIAKPSTLTGSSERGSAQHWLSTSTSGAGASNNSNARVVVVTSNPSSVPQTLTLHRIVTQVKNELIQTAAEDLSLSNNNNNHNRNNHNSNNSSSCRSSSGTRTQHQSISPLIISQGRLSASGPSAPTLRGQELTVIVGRQPVFSQELQTHHEPESDVSNNTEEQSLGCEHTQQHLHSHSHEHNQHHHHHHHHHQNHVEEEEEEPSSPSNNIEGHIETDRVSMSSMMIGAEHSYQVAHNGRLSPTGFSQDTSVASQYATLTTLTPLQPLPPISTMTDKFSYGHAAGNVAGSFTVMQHNGLAGLALASNPYSNYEKLPPMCVSPPHHYSTSPVNGLSSDHQSNGHEVKWSSRSEDMSSPPPKSPAYSPTSFSSPNDQSNRSQRSTSNMSPSPLQQNSSSNNHPTANASSQQQQHSVHLHHHSSSMLIHQHQQSTVVSSITPNGVGSPSSSHSSPPLATAVVVAHRDASSPGRSSPPLSVVFSASSTHPHITHTQSVGHAVLNSASVKQQQSVVSVVSSSASPGGVVTLTSTPAGSAGSISSTGSTGGELEEINTKELAARISAELKRYSIPQAIFAQRVLCRSQGTLSDLLRNPKPWSKLKSGRETFRRMAKWLQEPEFQRMSALRLAGKPTLPSSSPSFTPPSCVSSASSNVTFNASANPNSSLENDHHVSLLLYQPHGPMGSGNMFAACKRKEEQQTQPEQTPAPKKPRLVFTDLQRRTLQAIFKETKRPSKEMQVTIARQLGLEPTTVGNFFMNARRRSMDKWKEETDGSSGSMHKGGGSGNSGGSSNSSAASNSPSSSLSGQSGAQAQVVTVHHTPASILAQHGGASMDNTDANL